MEWKTIHFAGNSEIVASFVQQGIFGCRNASLWWWSDCKRFILTKLCQLTAKVKYEFIFCNLSSVIFLNSQGVIQNKCLSVGGDPFFVDRHSVELYKSIEHHQMAQEPRQLMILSLNSISRVMNDSICISLIFIWCESPRLDWHIICHIWVFRIGMWSQKCFWVWQDLSKIWFM